MRKIKVSACALLIGSALFGLWARLGAEYQFANGEFPNVAGFEHYRQAIIHELWLRLLTLPSTRPTCFSDEVTVCNYADQYASWQRWAPQSDDGYFAGLTVCLLLTLSGSAIVLKKTQLLYSQ